MDFGQFGAPPPSTQGQGQGPTPPPPNGNGNGNSGGDDGGSFMHTMEHTGVTCDVCSTTIRGFRYKCLDCGDYDLCSGCEKKGNHPGHIMMRIPFPENSRDAIRRFMGAGYGPSHPSMFFGGPGADHPYHHRRFFNHHGPRGGLGRCGFGLGPEPAQDSDGGDANNGQDGGNAGECPYGLGRKGMRKFAKSMKKMAYQQRRSAESYARTCAQAAAEAAGVPPATGQGQGVAGLDFTAAASQIQEFLNSFGIPIDVVELYDSYGNRGQPQQSGSGTGASASGAASTSQNADNPSATATEAPASTATAATVAAGMQELNLNNTSSSSEQQQQQSGQVEGAENSAAAGQSVTMDLDQDPVGSGWTLLDSSPPPETTSLTTEAVPSAPTTGLAAAAAEPMQNQTSGTFGTPTHPFGPRGPLYPSIPTPTMSPPHNLQQLLSGVSQAMNSVVRNIPIVTNPNPAPAAPTGSPPALDVKCTTTLNQLLAMGFSNHDGWLSRLVVAKNGDLEAVLNSLFPVGPR